MNSGLLEPARLLVSPDKLLVRSKCFPGLDPGKHSVGPIWHPTRELWIVVVVDRGMIAMLDPSGRIENLRHVRGFVSSLGLLGNDYLLALSDSNFVLVDLTQDSSAKKVVIQYPTIHLRPYIYDAVGGPAAIGPDGRWYVSTRDLHGRHIHGNLFCLDEHFNLRWLPEVEPLTTHGGIGWSPDGEYFYRTGSKDRVMYRHLFDSERGSVTSGEEFILWDRRYEYADRRAFGMTVDASGNLFLADSVFNCIHILSPQKERLASIDVPAQPTACALGGPEMNQLLITTTASDSSHQHGGGIYLADVPEYRGQAAARFRGAVESLQAHQGLVFD